ncbi:MAG TPA: tetratricopeptide repeat protein [Candidatus Methanoperedens sp.]
MELNQELLSKLDELVTLITLSKDGAIAFVLCNEPILRKELFSELEKRLESLNTKIINIELNEKSVDLISEIREKVQSSKNKVVIFVYGIEAASKAVTSSGKSAFLTKLNIIRDEFSTINKPVIIWSNEATLSKIAIEAPDFWSWRTAVFEFRMEKVIELLEKAELISESGLENLTIEELNEQYKRYLDLFNEYKKKDIIDDYKFADWYFELGIIHYLRSEYDEALKKFNQSMKLSKKLGDQYGMAYALHNIAIIYNNKGDYDKALEKYNRSLKIKEKLGDQYGVAQTLHGIALIHGDKGEYDEALEKYNQSLEIRRRLDDKRGVAQTLHGIAMIYQDKGEYEKALERYNQSLEIEEKLGNQRGIAKTLHQIAMVYQGKGEYNEAFEKYNQSLKIKEKLGDQKGIAYTLAQMGLLYSQIGKKEEAVESTQKALDIFEKIGLENEIREAKAQIEKIHS